MSSKVNVIGWCLALCFWSFLASATYAQVDRGAMVGTISDTSGSRVADAQITITNLETNQPSRFTTDTDGNWAAPLLKIGRYSVRVEKDGFQSALEASVDVGVNQVVRVDVTIKVGSASEAIVVTSAAPLLQTQSSSLGTIETARRITDLPLNGRNFTQLAYLGPGANSGQTGSNVSGGVFENERANEAISVNGLRVSNKQTLQCWYNPLAFSIPDLAPGQNSAHQFGNSHIGNLRGPDLIDFDFVLQKNFRIREPQALEFRAEFFNLFNHPNFGLPANNPDVRGGNSITSTATDNRQIEFALKYTF